MPSPPPKPPSRPPIHFGTPLALPQCPTRRRVTTPSGPRRGLRAFRPSSLFPGHLARDIQYSLRPTLGNVASTGDDSHSETPSSSRATHTPPDSFLKEANASRIEIHAGPPAFFGERAGGGDHALRLRRRREASPRRPSPGFKRDRERTAASWAGREAPDPRAIRSPQARLNTLVTGVARPSGPRTTRACRVLPTCLRTPAGPPPIRLPTPSAYGLSLSRWPQCDR